MIRLCSHLFVQHIVATVILTLSIAQVRGQSYTIDETKADLEFLVEQIQEYNPALFPYNPGFIESTTNIVRDVKGPVSPLEHLGLVSRICALSNEGHFGVGSWDDPVHEGFLQNTYRYFPIDIRLIEGKVYLWNDLSGTNSGIVKGSELLTMNGEPASEIIEKMKAFIPSDGHIETHINRSLQIGFQWMHYLFIAQPEQYYLEFKPPGTNDIRKASIPAITRAQMVGNIPQDSSSAPPSNETDNISKLYTFTVTNKRAVLTLRSFNRQLMEKHGIKSKKFYKKIFGQLRNEGVEELIIDLRDNTGGRLEMAFDMIPFIANRHYQGAYRSTVSWKGKRQQNKHKSRHSLAFNGPIVVLINAGTFSAAASLARYIKEYGNATFIGEETGTRYEGYAAGSKQYVTLPHSGLVIKIPRYWIRFPESEKQTTKNRGLVPDIEAVYALEDYLNRKDKAMEKANAYLSEAK